MNRLIVHLGSIKNKKKRKKRMKSNEKYCSTFFIFGIVRNSNSSLGLSSKYFRFKELREKRKYVFLILEMPCSLENMLFLPWAHHVN